MILRLGSLQRMILVLVGVEAAGALIRQNLSVTGRIVQRAAYLLDDRFVATTAVPQLMLVDSGKVVQRMLLIVVPVKLRARNIRQGRVACMNSRVRSAIATYIDLDSSSASFSATAHRHATLTLLLDVEVLLRARTSLSHMRASLHGHVAAIDGAVFTR